MKYLLAIDGGGTKTRALCANEHAQIIGEGYSGPTSLAVTSIGAASFNLREAVRQATEKISNQTEFECLVMGLAGMDTTAEQEIAQPVFEEGLRHLTIKKFILLNDSLIALESGTDKSNAVVLISGTGSNCVGRNEIGKIAKASGLDYLLSDQGSGYDIGLMTLKAAVKSYDGRGAKTKLEQLVCEYFHVAEINRVKEQAYNPALSKTEIADLAKLCIQAFDQGDAVAINILETAIGELNLMLKTVIEKLAIADKTVDVVLAGSIVKVPHIQESIKQYLSQLCPHGQLVVPEKDPVFGALKMALTFVHLQ